MRVTGKAHVSLSPDRERIHVFIPAEFGRRSGRKKIITPDGEEVNAVRNEEADARLLNALVKAHRWDKWIRQGKFSGPKAIAAAEKIASASYVSRLLKLVTLAPEIQVAMIEGRHPSHLTLEFLKRPIPMGWNEQREMLRMGDRLSEVPRVIAADDPDRC